MACSARTVQARAGRSNHQHLLDAAKHITKAIDI